MAGQIVDLDAVRELRRLVARLEAPCVDVELVRAIGQAAWRARDRQWIVWAAQSFDDVHDKVCSCRWQEVSLASYSERPVAVRWPTRSSPSSSQPDQAEPSQPFPLPRLSSGVECKGVGHG